ncbi:hypothetical protein SDC9_76889 [bioreactor metagenome]|uniref:Uncharacterized protein n=1 Tax=bioreactor metagenome TaxID=1076179 RepID=A0A644YR31_9ZZZZ
MSGQQLGGVSRYDQLCISWVCLFAVKETDKIEKQSRMETGIEFVDTKHIPIVKGILQLRAEKEKILCSFGLILQWKHERSLLLSVAYKMCCIDLVRLLFQRTCMLQACTETRALDFLGLYRVVGYVDIGFLEKPLCEFLKPAILVGFIRVEHRNWI